MEKLDIETELKRRELVGTIIDKLFDDLLDFGPQRAIRPYALQILLWKKLKKYGLGWRPTLNLVKTQLMKKEVVHVTVDGARWYKGVSLKGEPLNGQRLPLNKELRRFWLKKYYGPKEQKKEEQNG